MSVERPGNGSGHVPATGPQRDERGNVPKGSQNLWGRTGNIFSGLLGRRTDNSSKFIYPTGGYETTLHGCVQNKNEAQLRIWVGEYSKYKPTQKLFGKYFTNVEMLENFIVAEAKDSGIELSEKQAKVALRSFLNAQKRTLLVLFHPDKHTKTGIDKELTSQCFLLIKEAADELDKLFPEQGI